MARLLTLLLTAAAAACLLTVTRAEENLGCIDPDGKPVDWYVIYKLPVKVDFVTTDGKASKTSGAEYLFLSPQNSLEQPWILHDKTLIDSSDSALGRTLKPYYAVPSQYDIFCAYNDQPPSPYNTQQGKWGHSKGVLAKNTVVAKSTTGPNGFWLFHSLPKFTGLEPGYVYPANGKKNGQVFLCLTMTNEKQWLAANKYIDDVNAYVYIPRPVPAYTKNRCMMQAKQTPASTLTLPMTTTTTNCPASVSWYEGMLTKARTDKYECDLYRKAAEDLSVNFIVHTWMVLGEFSERSDSSTGNVEDIEYIEFRSDIIAQGYGARVMKFKSTKDHSKWAVTKSEDNPTVCVGDLSHSVTHMQRAGGMICLRIPLLWNAFKNLPTV